MQAQPTRGSFVQRPPVRSVGARPRVAAVVCCLLAILSAAALAALGAELALVYRTPSPSPAEWAAEENVEIVTRFYAAAWAGGRQPDIGAYIAAGHILHEPSTPGEPAGPEGVAQLVAGLRRALPDLVLTLDDVVARGDRVAVRLTARGTHRGPFLGAEGTGRSVGMVGFAVHRVADGQIAETWLNWDTFGLAQQVGLFLLPKSDLGDWERAPAGEPPGSTY